MTCVPSKDRTAWASAQSDQSSLCAFWEGKVPMLLHADSKGWLHLADVQADLSLCWGAHVIWLVLSCRGSYVKVTDLFFCGRLLLQWHEPEWLSPIGLFLCCDYCCICFSMGDLGVQVSVRSSIRPSISQHLPWVSFERNSSYTFVLIFLKLCMCFHHGMRLCMCFGYNPCIYFSYFFHFANFVIFWPQILWKCCDSGYLVSATPHTILYWPFWNFVHVFAMSGDMHMVWI